MRTWWLVVLVAAAVTPCLSSRGDDLQSGFKKPPISAWPQVWWHWVAGNVSKEGITADLEAMKRVGIGGGTIANIPFVSEGPAPFNTPAWREMVKHATREAGRLGLELGFFNCEGWSSSGGPWITPDQAMQTLVWNEQQIEGGGQITATLPQPTTRLGFYRDIALLAFPTPETELIRPVHDQRPDISVSAGTPIDSAKLWDDNPGTFVSIPCDSAKNGSLILFFAQPISVCGFRLTPGPEWTGDDVEFQVSDDGQSYRTVGKYAMPNAFLDTGVEWQTTPTFSQVSARYFRFKFHLSQGSDFQKGQTATTVSELEFVTTSGARVFNRTDVVDLTSKMDASGKVVWEAPLGNWTLARFGYTPIGKHNHPATKWGEGLECDKLSQEALRKHFEAFVDKVIADAGPLSGNTLAYSLIDSYECGEQNWTPAMETEFKGIQGYDLRKWLPALTGRVEKSADQSKRFNDDFRRTLTDLWNTNYYGAFAELLHKRGLKSAVEAYGNGVFDNLRASGLNDMPMSEFWFGNMDDGGISKMAASAAHVYGRPIVGAESFTSGDLWNFDPWSMKLEGDWIYSQGVNRYYFHSYAGQMWADGRKPGVVWPNGIHMTRNLTWWDPGKAYFTYLGRCQYLLQKGRGVADILSLGADDCTMVINDGRTIKPPTGYDYDGLDRDMLLQGITVSDGRIVSPGGTSYRLLTLPNDKTISLKVLRKVRELVMAGAIVYGPKPERAFGLSGWPDSDAEVKRIAAELWADIDGSKTIMHQFGNGRIYWTEDLNRLQTVLDNLKLLPDFSQQGADGTRLKWLHRRAGSAEIYFVSCQEPASLDAACTFRVSGLQPEIWDADSGLCVDAPVWHTEADGRTILDLRFEPAQSLFIVFRHPVSSRDHAVSLAFKGSDTRKNIRHTLEIRRAVYVAQDGFGTPLDMTAKIASTVRVGAIRLDVTNTLAGSDPAPLHVKELRVDYIYDGVSGNTVIRENGVLRIPATRPEQETAVLDLTAIANGLTATPWLAGTLDIQLASGKSFQKQILQPAAEQKLDGPWNVHFNPRWGGPAKVTFDTLVDWTKRAEEPIRHYSGTAVYKKIFQVPAAFISGGKRVLLDLGYLVNLAEVKVNGYSLGVIWKPPWRIDISGRLKVGSNKLEVAVTNLWANRLIGDSSLPVDKRVTFTTRNPYTPESPLQESGLMGPVVLRAAEPIRVR